MNLKISAYILALLILAGTSLALGVVPSSKDIGFSPGETHELKMKIKNNENKDFTAVLYAEGSLSQYIDFEDETVEFGAEDDYKIVSYTLTLPDEMEKQGITSTDIVIRAISGNDKTGNSMIQAQLSVVSQLRVNVPYSGKYVNTKLFAPRFKAMENSNFALQVKNLGTEDINEAIVKIAIFSVNDEEIDTIISDPVKINSKEEQVIVLPWTPSLRAGNYKAVSTLFYDGLSKVDLKTFQVGELEVDILSISVENFKFGGIAKFDMLVQNNWNEEIPNVYATVEVKDESGRLFTSSKTASVDLGSFGIGELEAFWDTQDAGLGKYNLHTTVHYVGQSKTKIFPIEVLMDEIKTSPTGQFIAGTSKKEEEPGSIVKSIYLLIVLVVILIGFNAYIYMKKIRGNDPPGSNQFPGAQQMQNTNNQYRNDSSQNQNY